MSARNTHDGFNLGPAGDTTAGPISLSDFTVINPSFMKLIDSGPIVPPPSEAGQLSLKRNPEEIARQLLGTQKRRTMLNSQETIESFKKENLELKLQVYQLKRANAKDTANFNTEEIEKDLIAYLLKKNEDLSKEIEERNKRDQASEREKRSMLIDTGCQTKLDRLCLDELFKASYTLRKQREQQEKAQQNEQIAQQEQHQYERISQQQTQSQPNSLPSHQHQASAHYQHQQSRHDKQSPHQVITQLNYPSVSMPRQAPATSRQMVPDEKALIERLCQIDGVMTVALDKLKAVSDPDWR